MNTIRKCFLKEREYIEKEKNMIRYFTDSLETSSVYPDGEHMNTKYPV